MIKFIKNMPPAQWELIKDIPLFISPIVFGYCVGSFLQRHEDNRMSRFRDKSALYGREMKPGEPPSWP